LDKDDAAANSAQMDSVRSQTTALFTEMDAWASAGDFTTGDATAVTRALNGFAANIPDINNFLVKGNLTRNYTQHANALLERTLDLHATVRGATNRRLKPAASVEQSVARYTTNMQKTLSERAAVLGVYQQISSSAKHRQQNLLKTLHSPQLTDILEQLELDATQAIMRDLDGTWWSLRQTLDNYLDASSEQVEAFNGVVSMLQSYTGQCKSSYAETWLSYKGAAAAETRAHEVLRFAWQQIVPAMGLLASKLVDGDVFSRFARADVFVHMEMDDIVTQVGIPQVCNSSNSSGGTSLQRVARTAVESALGSGLFGQTLTQVRIAFQEAAMLKDKHAFGGLGIPRDAGVVEEAGDRLDASFNSTVALVDVFADEVVQRLRKQHC